MKTHKLTLEM